MSTQNSALPKPPRRLPLHHIASLLVLAATLLGLAAQGASAPDFPPSPFDTAVFADRVPASSRSLQIPPGSDYMTPVSTNQAELALLREIRTLQTNLAELEAAVYAQDPWLKLYDQYIDVPHDWVMQHHREEFGASLRYFGPSGPSNTNTDSHTRAQLVALIDMALYKELASNTNFAPLLQGAFDAAASRVPTYFGTAYARTDRLIDYHPATRPTIITNFPAYVAEYDRRYDLVKAKLEALQRQYSVPADALSGQRWGDMYRMLSSSVQLYVEVRTPAKLAKLREELRRKYIDLSQARASLQPKPR